MHQGVDLLQYKWYILFPLGPVVDAGMAEAAAVGAAPHYLHHSIVLHSFYRGNRPPGCRVDPLSEVAPDGAVHLLFFIAGPDKALGFKESNNITPLSTPLFYGDHFFKKGLVGILCLPYEYGIKYFSKGLGVCHSRAAGNHYGVILAPFISFQRYASHINDVEHVCSCKLISYGEGDDIKLLKGDAGLKGIKRNSSLTQFLLKIWRRGKDPFAVNPLNAVEDVVKHLEGGVGHTYLVQVWIRDCHVQRTAVFPERAEFSAGVAGRFVDLKEYIIKMFVIRNIQILNPYLL